MRIFKFSQHFGVGFEDLWGALPLLIAFAAFSAQPVRAQVTNQDLSQQIQKLTETMERTQAQVEESQKELQEMKQQLAMLQREVAERAAAAAADPQTGGSDVAPQKASNAGSTQIEDIRERQAVEEAQIATHEQSKVESESKYPVKITGLVLLNGFVNTNAVDMAPTPALALPGSGSTGATVKQTVLGFDAQGPHLFGARSYADLRVDFDGASAPGSASAVNLGSYTANSWLLRLRTAHAGLEWQNTDAYFSLDRAVVNPDAPTSLTAVAIPALGWSGNLWTWNPQFGITQDFSFERLRYVRLQAALIDVQDAPLTPMVSTQTATPASTAERSRWPGVEGRIAVLGSRTDDEEGSHFGVGGYYSPHQIYPGHGFDAWAGTLDMRLKLPLGLDLTANAYRGQALGGLGGGAFKDFAYKIEADEFYFRPLDDAGGWAQLKKRLNERLELNTAFGLDNVFAGELRPYGNPANTTYQNLAKNRTFSGNVIYSPSAYLLFSLEYRRLESFPVVGNPAGSNIIGLGAGYKF